MQIRPHHLLCIGNFVGKGYSDEFTANMKKVKSALDLGESFMLISGPDDICASCPYSSDGICKDEEKVNRYDRTVKNILALEYGKEYKLPEIKKSIKRRVYESGKLGDICGDCEWAGLCSEVSKAHIIKKN